MAQRHDGALTSRIVQPGNCPPPRLYRSFEAVAAKCLSDRREDRDPATLRYRIPCVLHRERDEHRPQGSTSAMRETAVADSVVRRMPPEHQPARSNRAIVWKAKRECIRRTVHRRWDPERGLCQAKPHRAQSALEIS